MNAPLPPDPYKALGVETSADPASIKTAYRKLVLKCHPDKVLDPALKAVKQEEFQKVQQAYEILGDEDKRREYDLELKARRLREELYKNGPAVGTPPKKFYNVNIRTAEPPASFSAPQPPPPTKAYNPYPQPHFSQSWESRDMPHRPSKSQTFEEKTTRRAASYEKPKAREDDLKEERRRRKEEDRERERERERREERDREEYLKDKERERRREEKRERERKEEKDRQRAEAERREKEIMKAEKKRLERERDKERDKARRRDQEEKHRSKSKPAYVEPYSQSEDDVPVKTIKKSSSSSKKHAESPPRDKSSRKERDRSTPRVAREDSFQDKLAFAADYMDMARRKVPKVPASPYGEPPIPNYASAYPDPETWTGPPRRGSHDAKYAAKGEPVIIDSGSPMHKGPDVISVSPRGEAPIPSLRKSYTSPPGTMAQPPSSAVPPRIPTIHRAQTMQPEYTRDRGPPQAPAAPLPDKYAKHSDRRRRNSYDAYAEEDLHDAPPPRSGHHRSSKAAGQSNVKVYYVDKDEPRVSDRYDEFYPNSGSFPKIKVAQQYRPEQVYTAKRFTEDDVRYSNQAHTPTPYPQQYAY